MTEEIKEEQTIVPEIVDKGGERAVQVFDENAAHKMAEPFLDALETLDKDKGYSLTGFMKECLTFHAENAMVRTNIAQMEVVLQEQLRDWTKIRAVIGKRIEELAPSSATYIEEMKVIQDLNDTVTKSLGMTMKVIVTMKKEIRMTEFQSQYTMHLNIFQEFMIALQGLLWKHLQSTDKFEGLAADIIKLAKTIRTQE